MSKPSHVAGAMLSRIGRLFPGRRTAPIAGMQKTVQFKYGTLMLIDGRWGTKEPTFWAWETHIGNGEIITFPLPRFESIEQFEREATAAFL